MGTMNYRCRRCGESARNAYPRGCFGDQPCISVDYLGEYDDDDDDDDVEITRDDLIRLVVGMQWREMMHALTSCVDAGVGYVDADGGLDAEVVDGGLPVPGFYGASPTATTIVDEWLGVR